MEPDLIARSELAVVCDVYEYLRKRSECSHERRGASGRERKRRPPEVCTREPTLQRINLSCWRATLSSAKQRLRERAADMH